MVVAGDLGDMVDVVGNVRDRDPRRRVRRFPPKADISNYAAASAASPTKGLVARSWPKVDIGP